MGVSCPILPLFMVYDHSSLYSCTSTAVVPPVPNWGKKALSSNWAMASGDAKSQNPIFGWSELFVVNFSVEKPIHLDWKFHCASFGVWVCRVEIPVKENMEVRKFLF